MKKNIADLVQRLETLKNEITTEINSTNSDHIITKDEYTNILSKISLNMNILLYILEDENLIQQYGLDNLYLIFNYLYSFEEMIHETFIDHVDDAFEFELNIYLESSYKSLQLLLTTLENDRKKLEASYAHIKCLQDFITDFNSVSSILQKAFTNEENDKIITKIEKTYLDIKAIRNLDNDQIKDMIFREVFISNINAHLFIIAIKANINKIMNEYQILTGKEISYEDAIEYALLDYIGIDLKKVLSLKTFTNIKGLLANVQEIIKISENLSDKELTKIEFDDSYKTIEGFINQINKDNNLHYSLPNNIAAALQSNISTNLDIFKIMERIKNVRYIPYEEKQLLVKELHEKLWSIFKSLNIELILNESVDNIEERNEFLLDNISSLTGYNASSYPFNAEDSNFAYLIPRFICTNLFNELRTILAKNHYIKSPEVLAKNFHN